MFYVFSSFWAAGAHRDEHWAETSASTIIPDNTTAHKHTS